MSRLAVRFLCLLFLVHARPAAAQDAPPPAVFLDCQARSCNSTHIRSEITFVSWMRDRADADVYVLATSESTGGGGDSYRISTYGSGRFAGDSAEVRFALPQSSTDAERRDVLTARLATALVRYASLTSAADHIVVSADEGRTAAPVSANDPWNLWVFSAAVSGEVEGESREQSREFDLSLEAERVTALRKFELEVEGEYSEDEFQLSDGRRVRSIRRDYEGDALIAQAIASQWSAGVRTRLGTSTFSNQDFYSELAGILEHSFYPYEDFSRRQVILRYAIGGRHFNYADTTIYNRTSEVRGAHELALLANWRQPWGSADVELSASHYLHNAKRYNLSSWVNLNVRLVRGLSVDVSGSYARVRDQIYIPRGDASDEEVLLRRRALETGYRYHTSVGLRYTFGSVYSTVVNPRLGF